MLQSYKYTYHSDKRIEKILKSFFLLHPSNVELSLNRITRLLSELGDPQKKVDNIIQIAGTNGKGSIATILYNLQKLNGKKVNVYRSPHLIKFNERIVLLNKEISNEYLLELLEFVKDINKNQPITFFEILTAAAFYAFYKHKADINILEVGLGGRLDATNVTKKNLVSIISTIGIDHKEFLGKKIRDIAREKAGVIKKGSLVICSKQNEIAKKIILNSIKKNKNEYLLYGRNWKVKNYYLYYNNNKFNLRSLLLQGYHQCINASCAILACLKIRKLNINIGALEVYLNKIECLGRLQKLNGSLQRKYDSLNIWIDAAHNVLGFIALRKWVLESQIKSPIYIISLGIKKDYINILKEIKKANPSTLYLLSKVNFNNHSPKKILKYANSINLKTYIKEDILETLNYLKNKFKKRRKTVIITGSIGLIGNVLELDLKKKK